MRAVLLALLTAACAFPPEEKAEPAPEYIGEQLCKTCHTVEAEHWGDTVHAEVFERAARNDLEARGCEACHGPGSRHMANPVDPAGLVGFTRLAGVSVEQMNAQCLECHSTGARIHWSGSAHEVQEVACSDCHNPHPAEGAHEKALLREPQMKLCTGCHLQKKAQLIRPGHMPLREGKMECTSCHNPHGTPNDKMLLQTSVNQNFYTCHAEKRGPFLWEHAPVRENCLNCHDAHGTINEKMLKVKQPLLCQQCHQTSSHPGPAYPAQSRYAFNQGCMHCHPAVHGSVHPSGNRFFR